MCDMDWCVWEYCVNECVDVFEAVSSWSLLLILMIGARVCNELETHAMYGFIYIVRLSVISVREWLQLW